MSWFMLDPVAALELLAATTEATSILRVIFHCQSVFSFPLFQFDRLKFKAVTAVGELTVEGLRVISIRNA
jgi:hypothetical protein